MKKLTAFIDADILLHRAVSFCDDEFDGEEMADWRQALHFFDMLLAKWMKEVGQVGKITDYFLVVSKGRTFRKDLYPDYKANRKDIKMHPAFFRLKEEVMSLQAAVWEDNMEADDFIGIRCTENPLTTIAVSADKDFATIPCQLYVPSSHGKLNGSYYTFTEDEANLNWLRQAMTGDTIDNYKGIPGIGPKKAEKFLPCPAPLDQMWAATERAFIDAKMTSEEALCMARLARILRAGDYNFDTKETKLWEPSSLPTAKATVTTASSLTPPSIPTPASVASTTTTGVIGKQSKPRRTTASRPPLTVVPPTTTQSQNTPPN